jgi:hypothetical protein
MTSSESEWKSRLNKLFLTATCVAIALIVWGIVGADHKALALEAAKAGMQLGVVTALGAAVTYVLGRVDDARKERTKQAEVEREERRRLNDYRLAVFRDAIGAYNKVKTVRRTLRAQGLAQARGDALRPDQINQFNIQMFALNEAELSLERIEREAAAQAATFDQASAHVDELRTCEKYLRKILDVWETGALLTTEWDERQRTSIRTLDDFLSKRSEKRAEVFWSAIEKFEKAIRADLIAPLGTLPTAPVPVTPRQETERLDP